MIPRIRPTLAIPLITRHASTSSTNIPPIEKYTPPPAPAKPSALAMSARYDYMTQLLRHLTRSGKHGFNKTDPRYALSTIYDVGIPLPNPSFISAFSGTINPLKWFEQLRDVWRAKKDWWKDKDDRGIGAWMRTVQTMSTIAVEEHFHTVPPVPPHYFLLNTPSLSPSLTSAYPKDLPTYPPPIPLSANGTLPPGGKFIPINSSSSSLPKSYSPSFPPMTKAIEPRFAFKTFPVSLEVFRWAQEGIGKKVGKRWMDGYRWGAMESYLRVCKALAEGDEKTIKTLTAESFQTSCLEIVKKDRRESDLKLYSEQLQSSSSTKQKGLKLPNDLSLLWTYHGPTNPSTNPSGIKIHSIRLPPMQTNNPSVTGKDGTVLLAIEVDTLQSLQLCRNAVPIEPLEIKRVHEFLIVEKWFHSVGDGWGGWMIRQRMLDGEGWVPKVEGQGLMM